MTSPSALVELPIQQAGRPIVTPVLRPAEQAPAALHRGAIFLRVMSGLLLLVTVLHVINVMTGIVQMSYGVLFGEAIRLVVFAALLWGVADFADLSVKSHGELRAIRILLETQGHAPLRASRLIVEDDGQQ
jgi:hypothetical protein